MFMGYMGALYACTCAWLDGLGFTRAAQLATLLQLSEMASGAARPALQAEIAQLSAEDTAAFMAAS